MDATPGVWIDRERRPEEMNPAAVEFYVRKFGDWFGRRVGDFVIGMFAGLDAMTQWPAWKRWLFIVTLASPLLILPAYAIGMSMAGLQVGEEAMSEFAHRLVSGFVLIFLCLPVKGFSERSPVLDAVLAFARMEADKAEKAACGGSVETVRPVVGAETN